MIVIFGMVKPSLKIFPRPLCKMVLDKKQLSLRTNYPFMERFYHVERERVRENPNTPTYFNRKINGRKVMNFLISQL